MKQRLITVGVLAAAVGMYAAGLKNESTAVWVLAMILEIAFWKRVLARKPALASEKVSAPRR